MSIKDHFADIALCVALLALSLLAWASPTNDDQQTPIASKGPIHHQHREPHPAVQYLLNPAGMNTRSRSDGSSYERSALRDQRHEVRDARVDPSTASTCVVEWQYEHAVDRPGRKRRLIEMLDRRDR